jgi:3-oxoacyl-[acyl-carrier-protein] synthase I
MTTSVGLTALASCAAIRARLDGFKEIPFSARGSNWLVAAQVPLERPHRSLSRLVHLVVGPIRECLDASARLNLEDIPLLLGIAEPDRPGRHPDLHTDLLSLIEQALQVRLHPASRVIPMGRVAGAVGIREAAKLINEQGVEHVLVAGVDSHLVTATLASLDERNRLLSERNSNGFIPGEAGSAVLVCSESTRSGLTIRSLGLAVESAAIENDKPLRGDALASAYHRALDGAGLGIHQIDYRIADLSGEQYWFKEASLALVRTMRVRKEFQDIWHPADCIGEVGAAAAPCLLGIAWWAARKRYAPGPLALAQMSNDDGRRAAIVLDGTRLGGG